MKTESEKQTEKLNKDIASRCSVNPLMKGEVTEVMLRPIIAAGREQETRERHARLLDACDNAKKQNQKAKDSNGTSNWLNEWIKQAAEREDGGDCSTGNPDFPTLPHRIKVNVLERCTIESEHRGGLHSIVQAYKAIGLPVEFEYLGESGGFYYGMCWIGNKPIDEINAAKATFEL